MKKTLLLLMLLKLSGSFLFAQSFTSNLPIVIINTNGSPINDEPGVIVDFKIINNSSMVNNIGDVPTEYDGKAKAEFRGCTSQNFPKKSYGIELRQSDNTSLSIDKDLFGFPSESDWVLNASYTDKTFMRDVLAFHMSNLALQYASRTKYVEVIIDGTYQGLYVFQEKIKRGSGRVPIKKLENSDVASPKLSGGYILKIDKTCGNENPSWTSPYDSPNANPNRRHSWLISYPNLNNINNQQKEYIKNYIDQFEASAANSNVCSNSGGYSDYIDDNSFIDYILFQEVASNADAYRFSSFFYKNRDGKLLAGPVWDFNLSFGFCLNPISGSSLNYEGWRFSGDGDPNFPVPFFWAKLLDCPAFKDKLTTRYKQLRQTVWSKSDLSTFIDAQFSLLDQNGNGAYERNFSKWPILNTQTWTDTPTYVGGSSIAERDYLKTWLGNRLSWLDQTILGSPLPVTFSSFTVKKSNNQVLVSWSTSTEQNSSRFLIERSADARNFLTIGLVEAQGESNVEKKYSFTDSDPLDGMNYFRIRQVDLNEKFTYTSVRDILMPLKTLPMAYPNPASQEVNLGLLKTGSKIQLINASGVVVSNYVSQKNKTILNISSCPDGLYVISISNGSTVKTQKILIRH